MRWIVLLFLVGCNATLTRSDDVPDWLRAEWRVAQKRSALKIGDRAYEIHPEHFKFEQMPGVFKCGDVWANGCFIHGPLVTPTIQWNVRTPTAIRHEGGHAILWKAGHEDFKCVGHTC